MRGQSTRRVASFVMPCDFALDRGAAVGENTSMVFLGELVRRARREANMTQAVVAKLLGVRQVYFSRLELGEKRLALGRWSRLVEILPTLTLAEIARAHVQGGPVEIDACCLPSSARADVEAMLIETAMALHPNETKSAA